MKEIKTSIWIQGASLICGAQFGLRFSFHQFMTGQVQIHDNNNDMSVGMTSV